jgi:hypothetical protein
VPSNEEALQFASEMYSALLADQSAISLLAVELFSEPLYTGEGYPKVETRVELPSENPLAPIREFLANEGINGEYFIKFNRSATPLGYLSPWAKVELNTSDWLDYIWAIDPEIHLLSVMRDRHYIVTEVNAMTPTTVVSMWKFWKPTPDQL